MTQDIFHLYNAIQLNNHKNLAKLLSQPYYKQFINKANQINDAACLTPLEYLIEINREIAIDTDTLLDVLIKNGADVNLAQEKTNMITPLMRACIRNNIPIIKKLLSTKTIDINRQDATGNTALMHVAITEFPLIIKILIDAGADLDISNYSINKPKFLHYWAQNLETATKRYPCATQKKTKIVDLHIVTMKTLLNKYPQKINIDIKCHNGHNPLSYAINSPKMIKTFIDLGSDVNLPLGVTRYYSALHLAIEKEAKQEVIETLIKAGADINTRNTEGGTPLYTCLYQPKIKFHEYILKTLLHYNADPNIGTKQHSITPLLSAVFNNNTSALQELLNYKNTDINKCNKFGASAIAYSIITNNTDIFTQLLAKKDINLSLVTFADQRNVLHHAVVLNKPFYVKKILESEKCTQDIIDALDIYDHSPLQIALIKNNTEIISLFTQDQIKKAFIDLTNIVDIIILPETNIDNTSSKQEQTHIPHNISQTHYNEDDTAISTTTKHNYNELKENNKLISYTTNLNNQPQTNHEIIPTQDYYKKLHAYYQAKKLKVPKIVSSSLIPDQKKEIIWHINQEIITNQDTQYVRQTTNEKGEIIHVSIKLKLDNTQWIAFTRAIQKGFIKNGAQAAKVGMKYLMKDSNKAAFEVKIHGDTRLVGNEICYNQQKQPLFIIKAKKTHTSIIPWLKNIPSKIQIIKPDNINENFYIKNNFENLISNSNYGNKYEDDTKLIGDCFEGNIDFE